MKTAKMKKWIVCLFALLAVGFAVLLGLRVVRIAEHHRAGAALGMFAEYIFNYSKEKDVSLPVTLDEIPEWQEFVDAPQNKDFKALLQQIHYYYPLEGRNYDARIATIELTHSRLVLNANGTVFGEEK